MSFSMVFPGQGAQKVGMGQDFLAHPLYREHLEQADQILGYRLSHLIAQGPQSQLSQTQWAQPALFVVSTGIYKVWKTELGETPVAVAGHSLGEYSALIAAEVLSFEAGLKLVQQRSQLMQIACEQQAGAMAAIIRPQQEALRNLCEASHKQVVLANFNSPQQWVISGQELALKALLAEVQAQKLGRAILLPVSGAFHSPLMENARVALAAELDSAPLAPARFPIVMNVSATAETDPARIRASLKAQITAPVQWTATVQSLCKQLEAHAVESFVELGPATLGPLIRQNRPQAQIYSCAEYRHLLARKKTDTKA